MDIYIKPEKKIYIEKRKLVYAKDIGEIFTQDRAFTDKLKNIIVYEIKSDEKKTHYISIIDVVKAITEAFPEATVNNLGSADVLVEYNPKISKQNNIIYALKVIMVFIIVFFGSTTAVMSFHEDGAIPLVLENYYFMIFGEMAHNPKIIAIPYCIGLGLGIFVFFNHFSKIYLTEDPTPIEVQMTTYENETIANVVETLSHSKDKKE